jgi:twitching motility protein PilT
VDSNTTQDIRQIIDEGEFYGMQTFETSLLHLLQRGLVSIENALEAASNSHDMNLLLQQAGLAVGA